MIVIITTMCVTAVAIMPTVFVKTFSYCSITCWQLTYHTLLFHVYQLLTYVLFIWFYLILFDSSLYSCISDIAWSFYSWCTFCKRRMIFCSVRIIAATVTCITKSNDVLTLDNLVYWTNLDRTFPQLQCLYCRAPYSSPWYHLVDNRSPLILTDHIQCQRCEVWHNHDSASRGEFFQEIVSIESMNSLPCIQWHLPLLHYHVFNNCSTMHCSFLSSHASIVSSFLLLRQSLVSIKHDILSSDKAP